MDEELVLVCQVGGGESLGHPSHFLVGLCRDFANLLASLRRAFTAAQSTAGMDVYCLEVFYGSGEWGTVAGWTPAKDCWWERVPLAVTCSRQESVELETIKVTEEGVIFSACWHNGGMNDYFETPVLPWGTITTVEKTERGKLPDNIAPLAIVDLTANEAAMEQE